MSSKTRVHLCSLVSLLHIQNYANSQTIHHMNFSKVSIGLSACREKCDAYKNKIAQYLQSYRLYC